MALKIRLARGGSKKRPYYRIVVAESHSPRDGRFVEKVGTYNPILPLDHKERLTVVEARVRHWISVGAQPTDRVARMLSQLGMGEAPKVPNQTTKNQPKKKAHERLAALKAEKEAPAAQAAPAAPAAEETQNTEATAE